LGFKYAILCWQNRWLTQDMFMRRKAPVATWFHQINPSVVVMLKFDLADTNPRCHMMLPTAKQLWYPNSPNSSGNFVAGRFQSLHGPAWSFRRRMKTGSPVFTPSRTQRWTDEKGMFFEAFRHIQILQVWTGAVWGTSATNTYHL
jgi:hypothetical protein